MEGLRIRKICDIEIYNFANLQIGNLGGMLAFNRGTYTIKVIYERVKQSFKIGIEVGMKRLRGKGREAE